MENKSRRWIFILGAVLVLLAACLSGGKKDGEESILNPGDMVRREEVHVCTLEKEADL